jgi:hypothetical protein
MVTNQSSHVHVFRSPSPAESPSGHPAAAIRTILPLPEPIAADEPWRFQPQHRPARNQTPGVLPILGRLATSESLAMAATHPAAAIRTMLPPTEPSVTGTGVREDEEGKERKSLS